MTRTLKRIAPVKFGIVTGIIYGIFGLIFIPFILFSVLLSALIPQDHGPNGLMMGLSAGIGLIFCLLMPVFYAAMGCAIGMLMAWLYNVVVKWTGGIEFEVE